MTVLTLDAGGTNFVFSAIKEGQQVAGPIHLKAVADDLQGCLDTLVAGFKAVKAELTEEPIAISFAFPGPADYAHGILGDLPNFPSFRGGVALGPYLEKAFGIPVYINNDGNLFAYGEALAGALPMVNEELKKSGAQRRYRNLVGITLGTGYGCGVVIDKVLLTGDNGVGGDIWCVRNQKYPDLIVEESVSIRAVRRVYSELSGEMAHELTPKDICEIADGKRPGNVEAAKGAFRELGQMAAAALVNVLNIVDGIVVIGGGVAGAARHILPGMMEEFNRPVGTLAGAQFPTLQSKVYNWEDEEERAAFLTDTDVMVTVPGTDDKVLYSRDRKVAVMTSRLGASQAIMLGAYNYAVQKA